MATQSDIVSIRAFSSPVPFVLHVDAQGFVTVDERLLCLRFQLQDSSVLVEKEELDDAGVVIQTVYQKPHISDSGTFYKLFPGSYTIIGGVTSFDSCHSPIVIPRSGSSFVHQRPIRLRSRLPTVNESPENCVNLLSSDDDDDQHLHKPPHLGKNQAAQVVAAMVDGGSQFSNKLHGVGCLSQTIQIESFGISETPSQTQIFESPSESTPTQASTELRVNQCSERLYQSPSSATAISSSILPCSSKAVSTDTLKSPFVSIYPHIVALGSMKSSKSDLKIADLASFPHHLVKYLPSEYNGNAIFELPPLLSVKEGGAGKLDGMDCRSDGHAWTETTTTNISEPTRELTFKYVKCLGHLRCMNSSCPHVERSGEFNDIYWEGSTPELFSLGSSTEVHKKCSLVCRFCKSSPTCLKLCSCKLFYIVSKNSNMSRAAVHFGTHDHPVASGECREALDLIHEEILTQVARTPNAKASAIGMAVGKELLLKGLVDENSDGKKLSKDELALVFDKWAKLGSPNIRNMIVNARQFCGQGGYIDNILKLKKASTYDYIQDSVFPGQGSNLVYLFKMSTSGAGSGVDLVQRMQPGGDLENEWVMFDHVKRVKEWTTLGIHVYDPSYYKVMTIAVCDMQSETTEAQERMWLSMLSTMEKHGVTNVNFKGFMADSAQANFNAIRKVFGSGDPREIMEGKERTCQFHWSMALDRHTKQLVKPELQERHRQLCHEYRRSRTKSDADANLAAIKAWWFSSGAVAESSLKELNDWINFWHFRFHQWGSHISEFLSFEEEASVPTCNLSETIHNKWLQASGNDMVDLYNATLDDYCRAALQSTQYHNFLKGRLGGNGPDKKVLKLRLATQSGNPTKVAQVIRELSSEAGFNSRIPHLEGETIFGTTKRKLDLPPGDDNDSHRHDRVNFTLPKLGKSMTPGQSRSLKRTSRSTHVSPTPIPNNGNVVTRNGLPISESPCSNPLEWRIERISPSSKDQCRGYHAEGKRCNARVAKYKRSIAAPTFTGIQRKFKSHETEQKQFWFCPTNIETCVLGGRSRYIVHYPDVPEVWPIKMGTNLSQIEVDGLEAAGFSLAENIVATIENGTRFKLQDYGDGFGREDDFNFQMDSADQARPPKACGDYRPTLREGKKFNNVAEPSAEHYSKFNNAKSIECTVVKSTKVPLPGYGIVYTIYTPGSIAKQQLYEVTIGDFPACTCLDFITMKTSALGRGQKKWILCKHLYYILQRYMECTVDDKFIHRPAWTFNEVKMLSDRADSSS